MQKSILSCRAAKVRKYRNSQHTGPDLENNFILRLPEKPAAVLREDLRQGQVNIKDRLSVQLDYTQDKEDMRSGVITFDTLMYKARLYDLPTILETWKTIDGKNFYKNADVCQMLIARENGDFPEEDDTKKKKRDPNKVERKYLWPHGYTPPLKNVRKKRFRKTLRKKHVDMADIEKEVKRLLRADNEAIGVKWEIVREEDEKKLNESQTQEGNEEPGVSEQSNPDKQTLFGELSSSEDEIPDAMNIVDDDEDSRLTVEDSESLMNEMKGSPSSSKPALNPPISSSLITEFDSSMFIDETSVTKAEDEASIAKETDIATSIASTINSFGLDEEFKPTISEPEKSGSQLFESDFNQLYSMLAGLNDELTKLLAQRAGHQAEANAIDNPTLKQKFLDKVAELDMQIKDKESQIAAVRSQLHNS